MDERRVIHSAIVHINDAKSGLENISGKGLSLQSQQALDLAYQSLDKSIKHCQAIFGPATVEAERRL